MREALQAALVDAQNSQDKCRICTLRLINAAVKDRDIAHRSAGQDPVSDEEIMIILQKMIKQREESAETYERSNRLDLAEQERHESEVIREFLPHQLDEQEVTQVCANVVEETGAAGLRDMGRCMNKLKTQYPGQMDFSKASGIVKDLLR